MNAFLVPCQWLIVPCLGLRRRETEHVQNTLIVGGELAGSRPGVGGWRNEYLRFPDNLAVPDRSERWRKVLVLTELGQPYVCSDTKLLEVALVGNLPRFRSGAAQSGQQHSGHDRHRGHAASLPDLGRRRQAERRIRLPYYAVLDRTPPGDGAEEMFRHGLERGNLRRVGAQCLKLLRSHLRQAHQYREVGINPANESDRVGVVDRARPRAELGAEGLELRLVCESGAVGHPEDVGLQAHRERRDDGVIADHRVARLDDQRQTLAVEVCDRAALVLHRRQLEFRAAELRVASAGLVG